MQRRHDLRALRGAERQRAPRAPTDRPAGRPASPSSASAFAVGARSSSGPAARRRAPRSRRRSACPPTRRAAGRCRCPPRARPRAIPARDDRSRCAVDRRACRHRARTMPARIFTSVLLPAPFSPTSACTVPARDRELAPRSTARRAVALRRASRVDHSSTGTWILPATISSRELARRALHDIERQQRRGCARRRRTSRRARRARARAARPGTCFAMTSLMTSTTATSTRFTMLVTTQHGARVELIAVDADRARPALPRRREHAVAGLARRVKDDVGALPVLRRARAPAPSGGSANAFGSVPAYADSTRHVGHTWCTPAIVARLELADQRDLHAADEPDRSSCASCSPAIAPTRKLPSCSRNRRPARFGRSCRRPATASSRCPRTSRSGTAARAARGPARR